ncbi:A C2HC-type zinc-finger protein (macronuclear) [Tetrahymena thermophila SB210]|uniref:A C2HC-type zinc-finger protein n=1 Tax=Tetrahymena thermophila (strain SB210) TaxID=312017 RepID=I7M9L7_TETTS|nr:A C2HC-type zinc-finger protein [Tetrahymena thermophila SB210]EAS02079.2 A C2HC-type zinc-finger protein [Tetrahymena thermophila SB210]|eukprot:XP_001022324.2 A C2HC-type zinc-finger protein [Tetrahymena thermophila SB210]
MFNQNDFDSIDYLVAYDNKMHENQNYSNLKPVDYSLRLQPSQSSYQAYRDKNNLAMVGEQILMDGIPRFEYDYSAYNSKIIQPKATGKIGQHYFDGGLKETAEEMIQRELENCLFNIKKTMRRNQAKAKGFDILEKERDPTYISNELYENVVFDDIYDKPNQNYRRVFYAPELNEQELIENNTGEELNYDYDIDDFLHIQQVQDTNIENKMKRQSILNRLNKDIQKQMEEQEMAEREQNYQMEKQQNKSGILKKKGDQKIKKTLKFDDSVIDKNESSIDDESDGGFAKQLENGKVKMSFKEFMDAQKGGGKRQTQSAKALSNGKISSQIDYVDEIASNEPVYNPTDMPKKIPRWKLQSEAIRASMKTSSAYTKEENEQIVSALNKTDLVYCECCKRKFKPGPAEKHIPSCKEKFEEKQRQYQFQQQKKKSKSSSKI